MKVFLSWSKELSRQVAELLSEWIPSVIQQVKPWFSPDDIEKGKIWFDDIQNTLSETEIGVICLTEENLESPWLHFEAGALHKGLSTGKICTLLIGLENRDIQQPFSNFNSTSLTKSDLRKMFLMIYNQLPDQKPSEKIFNNSYDRFWDFYSPKLDSIVDKYKPDNIVSKRTDSEIIDELLNTNRQLVRSIRFIEKQMKVQGLSQSRNGKIIYRNNKISMEDIVTRLLNNDFWSEIKEMPSKDFESLCKNGISNVGLREDILREFPDISEDVLQAAIDTIQESISNFCNHFEIRNKKKLIDEN